jgi:hypothetical protein
MRKTKIVCTIGPASCSEERLEALILAGMDVARLNFSHGTHEQHGQVIKAVRTISERLGRSVAILQDLCGPKIRTGVLEGGKAVELVEGAELTVTTQPVTGTSTLLSGNTEAASRFGLPPFCPELQSRRGRDLEDASPRVYIRSPYQHLKEASRAGAAVARFSQMQLELPIHSQSHSGSGRIPRSPGLRHSRAPPCISPERYSRA